MATMSLACAECDRTMGPTKELPGEDGVMVSPNLLALVWSPQENGGYAWNFILVPVDRQRALCFRCVSKKISPQNKGALRSIYRALEAETCYLELKMEQRGKMINFADDRSSDLLKDFAEKERQIDANLCLTCAKKIGSSNLPFFSARTFDKPYCRQFQAGFHFLGEHNYSITNHLQLGSTSFQICFDCLAEKFPRQMKCFSYDLQQIPLPAENQSTNTLMVTEEMVDLLRKEIGTKQTEEQLGKLNVKIIGPGQN